MLNLDDPDNIILEEMTGGEHKDCKDIENTNFASL